MLKKIKQKAVPGAISAFPNNVLLRILKIGTLN